MKGTELYDIPSQHHVHPPLDVEESLLVKRVEEIKSTRRELAKSSAQSNLQYGEVSLIHFGSYKQNAPERRYATSSKNECQMPASEDVRDLVQELDKILHTITEPHVTFQCPWVVPDESFIVEGLFTLHSENKKDGCIWGAWIPDERGIFNTTFLTKQSKQKRVHEIFSNSLCNFLISILSLSVFRKNEIIKLITKLKENISTINRNDSLFSYFENANINFTLSPRAVIYESFIGGKEELNSDSPTKHIKQLLI